jgi:tRNA threonylcarbamoyladenosine biosynthesis protein TsaE
MKTITRFLATEIDTIKLGEHIARKCKAGDIICLVGDLGAGKTTLVKGLAKGLKIKPDNVHSPTFVLMNHYAGKLEVFHFDLYRLDKETEISAIGYDEFIYGNGVAVIEWADKMGSLMPKEYLYVELKHKESGGREVEMRAVGKGYERFIRK